MAMRSAPLQKSYSFDSARGSARDGEAVSGCDPKVLTGSASIHGFAVSSMRICVLSELWVGFLNGLIFGLLCGVLLTTIAESYLNSSRLIGLTVGIGIILAVSIASLIGSMAPIIFRHINIDPAISTGPCVTIMNDIVGLAIYLGVTSLIYSYFGIITQAQ